MSNKTTVYVTVPTGSRDRLYVNLFSFAASYLQKTTITCDKLKYRKSFQSTGPSHNTLYGSDTVKGLQPDQTYEFVVEMLHSNNNGASWQDNTVFGPVQSTEGPCIHTTVVSEDAIDMDGNDSVVFFDLFVPGRH